MASRASYGDIRAALEAQLNVLVVGFAELDPQGPSDCAGWTVADVETHMAQNTKGLAAVAERKVESPEDVKGVEGWAGQLAPNADYVDGLVRADSQRLKDHVGAALQALEDYPEDTVVKQLTGQHSLRDAAAFRLIEGVVHGMDVGIEPDRTALKVVVKALAQALADRYPGHTVELRIPPYTAVQLVEGPRHTRGTPPNVVETDARSFLRLITGREQWDALIKDGRVRASGERSDLSGLLPLMR